MDPSCFTDYACAKAYDTVSRGRYKKFLLQSKAAGEEWACKSVQSVKHVQGCMDAIQKKLQDLACDGPASHLAQACTYVLDMQLPPRKHSHAASTCYVTGLSLGAEVIFSLLHGLHFFPGLIFVMNRRALKSAGRRKHHPRLRRKRERVPLLPSSVHHIHPPQDLAPTMKTMMKARRLQPQQGSVNWFTSKTNSLQSSPA